LRHEVGGELLLRNYSLASTPGVAADPKVTIKRVVGGRISNAVLDTVWAGAAMWVMPPKGIFCLREGTTPLVLFAAGIAGLRMQDVAVQEDMGGPIAQRHKEKLGATDLAIVMMRRKLLNTVKGMQQGTEPSQPGNSVAFNVRSVFAEAQPDGPRRRS